MNKKEKFTALDNAVKDLLAELRIDYDSLSLMAKGYSPDYPGVSHKQNWINPYVKVQLSKIVAKKLLHNLDFINEPKHNTEQLVIITKGVYGVPSNWKDIFVFFSNSYNYEEHNVNYDTKTVSITINDNITLEYNYGDTIYKHNGDIITKEQYNNL